MLSKILPKKQKYNTLSQGYSKKNTTFIDQIFCSMKKKKD